MLLMIVNRHFTVSIWFRKKTAVHNSQISEGMFTPYLIIIENYYFTEHKYLGRSANAVWPMTIKTLFDISLCRKVPAGTLDTLEKCSGLNFLPAG